MGIQKARTTAYHPQGNWQIERQNRTLQEILSTFVSEHPDTWDLHIDQAVFAYNTSRHESTGFSPYELVFGRVACMLVEIDLGVPLRDLRSQSDYVQAVKQSIRSSQSIAQQVQLKAKAKKQFYDQGREFRPQLRYRVSFGLGDLKTGSLGESGLGRILLFLEEGLTIRSSPRKAKNWFCTTII